MPPADSFPPELLTTEGDGRHEPLAADFRKVADVNQRSTRRHARLKLLSALWLPIRRFWSCASRRGVGSRVLGGTAMLAVLTAVSALVRLAVEQRDVAESQRAVADAGRLAAESQHELARRIVLSLLLASAISLLSADGSWAARISLLSGIQSHPHVATFLTGHKDEVNSVAFSPDGKTLASASVDKTVMLWHMAVGKPLGVHGGLDALREVRCTVTSKAGMRSGSIGKATISTGS